MLYREAKKVLFIALAFGGKRRVRIVQQALASRMGMSQQSVSRLLKILEEEGYIMRSVKGRGEFIEITEKGLSAMEELYGYISRLMSEEANIVILEGKVVSGLGEGQYYMKLPYYRNKIGEILGFDPYPGTLNVQLDGESSIKRLVLTRSNGLRIEGYRNKERFYGGATLFKSKINGYEKAAIIIPDRTSHPKDVIEVIAPVYLRGELGLNDGDRVVLEVSLESGVNE
ncbi:MAG: DUF120 domain-containing protein [Fervidicoccaceae archaeon]